jgi:hypothetical protein
MELFFIVVNAWPPPLVIESVEYAESLSMSCCISGVIVGVVLLVEVLVFGLPDKSEPAIEAPPPINAGSSAARNGILFSFELRFGESVPPHIRGLPAAQRMGDQRAFALESETTEERAHGIVPSERVNGQFADAFGEHLRYGHPGRFDSDPLPLEIRLEDPMRGAKPRAQPLKGDETAQFSIDVDRPCFLLIPLGRGERYEIL